MKLYLAIKELREVYGSIPISIYLIYYVLQLSLGRVLSQGPHDGPQLLGGDSSVAILVE